QSSHLLRNHLTTPSPPNELYTLLAPTPYPPPLPYTPLFRSQLEAQLSQARRTLESSTWFERTFNPRLIARREAAVREAEESLQKERKSTRVNASHVKRSYALF